MGEINQWSSPPACPNTVLSHSSGLSHCLKYTLFVHLIIQMIYLTYFKLGRVKMNKV